MHFTQKLCLKVFWSTAERSVVVSSECFVYGRHFDCHINGDWFGSRHHGSARNLAPGVDPLHPGLHGPGHHGAEPGCLLSRTGVTLLLSLTIYVSARKGIVSIFVG